MKGGNKMSSKANTQHMKLINKLKRIEEYKNTALCITVETWCHPTRAKETKVTLWSGKHNCYIFKGSTMSELERFINSERDKAGLFKGKK
jgi:hypothetical protein